MKKILAYLLLVTFSSYSFAFGLGGGGMGGASDDILTTADEGVLDAGTLDSLDSLQFLRGDTADAASGELTLNGGLTIEQNDPTVWIKESDASVDSGIYRLQATADSLDLRFFSDDLLSNSMVLHIGRSGITTGNINFPTGVLQSSGNTVWHAGNDGSGSGLNADTVDSITATSFLRSDATDSASGDLTFSGDVIHTEACASGYTRVSVNKCLRNTASWNTTFLSSCTAITAPDAAAVSTNFYLQITAWSANSVLQRKASMGFYSDSGCSSFLDGSDIFAYEHAAVASTIIGSNWVNLDIVLPSAGATIYAQMTRDAGGNSLVYWREKSYTD